MILPEGCGVLAEVRRGGNARLMTVDTVFALSFSTGLPYRPPFRKCRVFSLKLTDAR